MKGFKGAKLEMNNSEARESILAHMDIIFSRFPFSEPVKNLADDEPHVELNIGNLDRPNPQHYLPDL